MIFAKNLKLKKNRFILLHLIFSCYYCSIDLKNQSEHPELRKKNGNAFRKNLADDL